MQTEQLFLIDEPDKWKKKALHWAGSFGTACYFDSNSYDDPYAAFDVLIAAGVKADFKGNPGDAFTGLDTFLKTRKTFIPGFLGYDLKNETEQLFSENPDHLQFPGLYFFEPLHLLLIKGAELTIFSAEAASIHEIITEVELNDTYAVNFTGKISSRFSHKEYTDTVKKLQQHIYRGDIYEINFCQEFFAENAALNAVATFLELNRVSPAPFSTFFKLDENYIISATPERFLSKKGNTLISQPIKGTAPRNKNRSEDERLKADLLFNGKEQAENVMIVDIVRNDMVKSAIPGTVKVKELFGIYSFSQVHQMISTVVCEAAAGISGPKIIENTFPMGSMTGAPKIKAMQLIEQYERTKRGVFSGSAGYFSPNGDFDFNVIIRTILYNAEKKYLSFQVGSAITLDAGAEQEYEECLLKAKAIHEVLSHKKPGINRV